IFEPHSCYLFRHCEKKSDLWRWLAALPKGKALRHHFVFTFLGNPPPQRMEQDLKKLCAHVVPCYEPAPHEINKFILGLGKKYGLQLDAFAVAVLKESQGNDLFKLENEMVKLSLIFAEEKRPLVANDL